MNLVERSEERQDQVQEGTNLQPPQQQGAQLTSKSTSNGMSARVSSVLQAASSCAFTIAPYKRLYAWGLGITIQAPWVSRLSAQPQPGDSQTSSLAGLATTSAQ